VTTLEPGRPPAAPPRALAAWWQRARVGRWVHFLVLPLAAFDPQGIGDGALLAAARGVASAFALLAFGFLLNSVADREMDLDARKNPFIAGGAAIDRRVRAALAALAAASLLLALAAPWPAQVATVVCLLFAWTYSMGPRLKRIPLVGSLANVGNFGPLLFVGMHGAALPPRFGAVAVSFSAVLLQNQLIHEAGDAAEDRRGALRTTWLTLGPAWTAALTAALGLGAAAAAAWVAGPGLASAAALATGAVFGLAFPAALAWRGRQAEVAARLRLAHRGAAVLFGAALYAVWRLGP